MPYIAENPRDSIIERQLRQTEPYKFQRDRQLFNKQPRLAQPNTSQPNQLPLLSGWEMTTEDYYREVFQNYLKRRMR